MTKTAYLRVYTPNPALSDEGVPDFVLAYGMLSEPESAADWVVEWKGETLVCPRHLRLRVLESTIAFARTFSGMGAGLVPEASAQAATAELRSYTSAHPNHRSQVLTSAWHVPVRWFSLFEPEDREVYGDSKAPSLRFRTPLRSAKSRLESVVSVLRPLPMFQGPIVELEQLAEWLDQFGDDGMVELDYDTVSDLFDPQELVLDDSVELIAESVSALAAGDMMRAGENYGRVVTRWAPAYSVTFSN